MTHNNHFATLTRVIQIAIDGGWDIISTDQHIGRADFNEYEKTIDVTYHSNKDGLYDGTHTFPIFNHDFAKALWGKGTTDCYCGGYEPGELEVWEAHLSAMVIADDPIKYLEENT